MDLGKFTIVEVIDLDEAPAELKEMREQLKLAVQEELTDKVAKGQVIKH